MAKRKTVRKQKKTNQPSNQKKDNRLFYSVVVIVVLIAFVTAGGQSLFTGKTVGNGNGDGDDDDPCCDCPPDKVLTKNFKGTGNSVSAAYLDCDTNAKNDPNWPDDECKDYCQVSGPGACECCEPDAGPVTTELDTSTVEAVYKGKGKSRKFDKWKFKTPREVGCIASSTCSCECTCGKELSYEYNVIGDR